MKKIMLILTVMACQVIASDTEDMLHEDLIKDLERISNPPIGLIPLIAELSEVSAMIKEVNEAMTPLLQEINAYGADPDKSWLIEQATGLSPERIVYECEQEIKELGGMLWDKEITPEDFCDGIFDLRIKLPAIIADKEKYTLFYSSPEGNRESMITYYDE